MCRRWREEGDEEALCALFSLFEPLLNHYAHKMAFGKSWVTAKELKPVGKCAMMEAFDHFDPDRGVKLSTYLITCIQNAIWNSSEYTCGVPLSQIKIHWQVLAAQDELIRKLDRKPTVDEIACKAGLTRKQVLNALEAMKRGHPEQPPEQGLDMIYDSRSEDPETAIIEALDAARKLRRIEKALASGKFSEKEINVIALCYIQDMPDSEIAERLATTTGSVKVSRKRALDKLLRLLAPGEGKDYAA